MSNEEKYLLWAVTKSWHHNSPIFWGKNNCGYYSNEELIKIFTYLVSLDSKVKDSELDSKNLVDDIIVNMIGG